MQVCRLIGLPHYLHTGSAATLLAACQVAASSDSAASSSNATEACSR